MKKSKRYIPRLKNFALLLSGVSSSGKSTLARQLREYYPSIEYLSSDEIFYQLIIKYPGYPWKNLKPKVTPLLVKLIQKKLNRSKTIHLIVDDNKLEILYEIPELDSVLLFCPLYILARNAFSRPLGDRRPLEGILLNYTEFYKVGQESGLEKLSINDLIQFLRLDPSLEKRSISLAYKAGKKLGLPLNKPEEKLSIVPRFKYYSLILDCSTNNALQQLENFLKK